VQPDAELDGVRVDALLAAAGGPPARYDAAPLLPDAAPRPVRATETGEHS
jgi:hypothetical protein